MVLLRLCVTIAVLVILVCGGDCGVGHCIGVAGVCVVDV